MGLGNLVNLLNPEHVSGLFAANACNWLFAWQKGAFRKASRVLFAVALLLFSFLVLYVGLQALASSLGGG